MRITVGISSLAEAEHFLEQGAQELYCGFAAMPSHRASAGNFKTVAEIGRVADAAHRRGAKLFVAVNEINSNRNAAIVKNLRSLEAAGVDAVILRDPALFSVLDREGIGLCRILSSLAFAFNSKTLEYFHGLGIKRVTLPQQITAAEAKAIINNPYGIETEVFFIPRDFCSNIDGLCFFTKHQYGCVPHFLCRNTFSVGKENYRMPQPDEATLLGMFYDYWKAGAHYLKISRTENFPERMIMFKEASRLLEMLEQKPKRAAFLARGAELMGRFTGLYEAYSTPGENKG